MTLNSFALISQTIEQEFYDNWDRVAIPIVFDNKKTATPASTEPSSLDEFVRLSVLIATSDQAELQINPGKRVEGFVQISHFLQSDSGSRRSWVALDTAKLIFEMKTVLGITFRSASPTVVGEDEGFHQILIRIPFFTFVDNGV